MIASSRNNKAQVMDPLLGMPYETERYALDEDTFQRMLAVERKRTERTKAPFLLLLLEVNRNRAAKRAAGIHHNIISATLASSRDTDLVGWYTDNVTIGVIFTGLTAIDKLSSINSILLKTRTKLQEYLTPEQLEEVEISFHLFPDDWDRDKPGDSGNRALYLDITNTDKGRRPMLVVKRAIDILGSAMLLVVCSPLFLMIALAIKVSSDGPVLFRQRRVGRYGKTFLFLKFRSMYVNSNCDAHRNYVTRFIVSAAGPVGHNSEGREIYKLTDDKRITSVGKFLRRSSLDELPQLLNVLKGDMSLVGPRPPIPYELEAYQTWHRRRLLSVKPGITGLWQVTGRSSIKFDDMVRLDLRYASTWTLWVDLRILFRTPLAVIKGVGAY